jgi:hypothetical protein
VNTDVIIVGAGLAGLTAAGQLQTAGYRVVVLDKGRSVGGRLATRRIQAGRADHGAQFFTVRTGRFQQQVDDWQERDVVFIWSYGWSDGSIKRTAGDGHPRYVAHGGMNNLAKDLAAGLEHVYTETEVIDIEHSPTEGFTVRADPERVYNGRVLILTPPAPQAYELARHLPFTDDDRAALERINYGPCLAGMFAIEGDVNLPEPGALQDFERTVYWIADNRAKGISDETIITLHAGSNYSDTHYDDPDEQLLAFLRGALQNFLGEDASIKEEQLKRWRYSVPLTTHPQDVLQTENMPLLFAGDAFGGRGRIEGAYLSGLAAGDAAQTLLDR